VEPLDIFIEIILPLSLWLITEVSTSDIFWGQRRLERRADNMANFVYLFSRNSGSLDIQGTEGPFQPFNRTATPGSFLLPIPMFVIDYYRYFSLQFLYFLIPQKVLSPVSD
jgi:hypothetical protein